MSSHVYLLGASLKNSFKELFKKPGKLILYLILILLIVGAMVASAFGASHTGASSSTVYLLAIFLAFLALYYVIAIQKGLASGDTIFEMSDVNLLFVAPVSSRATLMYGLFRLAGTSFWAGFFILFQSGSLSNFGVDYFGVLILFATFILTVMVLTLLSQLIYSVSNSNPRRKQIVRVLAAAIFLPMLVFFMARYAANGSVLPTLNDLLASPLPALTPLIGWAAAGAIALVDGNIPAALGWYSLLILSGGAFLLYLMLSRADYYEDVLVATETAFEKKRAVAEGQIQVASAKAIKVKKTGLSGRGAQVFLYKHLRETFRANRFGFFSLHMLITGAAIIAACTLVLRGDNLLTILQILMWIQVFLIGTGRGLMELYSHYLFMVPAPPFQKVVWSNMELIARTFAEGIVFLGIPGLLMGSNPLVILGCMAAYILFSLLLLGANYLFMHWTGADISKGLLLMIYFFAVLLLMAPGIAAALFVAFSTGGLGGTLLGLLILSGWELMIALICFSLSKNILHNCDMPTIKPR